jgi:hypothetical protein
MRGTSAIFRKIFAALEAEIRPGRSEADSAGCASRIAKLHGCRDAKRLSARSAMARVSESNDDQVTVWIETPGPTGYWLELRRCYSFGAPPARVQRFRSLIEECWDVGLRAIRPGLLASEAMAKIGP